MKTTGELLRYAINEKQLIDPFTMHLLAMAYTETTQNNAGGLYIMKKMDLAKRRHAESLLQFKKIDEFAKLVSEKQTKKAMEGKIKEIHQRYEPKDKDQAMDQGFSGQQCENCKSFRVGYDRVPNPDYDKEKDPLYKKHDTRLMCYGCLMLVQKKTENLPKQSPLIEIEWTS